MKSSKQIRQEFISFFEERGHRFVRSAPVVPNDDPTLLFSNSGMAQFKEVFLGTGVRDYNRAVNSQKCIRASGKHNDLEDVGHDNYHHTFFEMLGNWSFGDYFKKEAIEWAWELMTGVWRLPKDKLWATVFEGGDGVAADEEAENFWRTSTGINPNQVYVLTKKIISGKWGKWVPADHVLSSTSIWEKVPARFPTNTIAPSISKAAGVLLSCGTWFSFNISAFRMATLNNCRHSM